MTILLERPDLLSALTPRHTPSRHLSLLAPAGPADRTVSHPHTPGLEIVGADATVPLAGGGRIAYANLDHGASAPALRVVKQTVDALIERYASVHRGAGWHSKICTELYEGAREPVRDFVGGRTDDAVIFTGTPPIRSTYSRIAYRRGPPSWYSRPSTTQPYCPGSAAAPSSGCLPRQVPQLPLPRSTMRSAAGRPAPRCW